MDREIGSRMGHLAVESLIEGKTDAMTAIQNGQLLLTSFPGPDSPCRQLQANDLLKLSGILAT